jgi:hypothetical protein
LTISIDFLNILLAFKLFSYFGPFLSIFEAFYHPSFSRPILADFSEIFDCFYCPPGYFRPICGNFPKRASRFNNGSKSIEKKIRKSPKG